MDNNYNADQTPVKASRNGLGTVGMVLGITALVTVAFFIGGLIGIIGLILSAIGLTRKNCPHGPAIVGIVLNALSILIVFGMLTSSGDSDSKNINSNELTPQTVTSSEAPNVNELTPQTATPTEAPNSNELTPQTATPTKSPDSDDIIDVDISNCHIKYLRHELTKNRSGEACLAIYYEFTNNSGESDAFGYTISDNAYQDGVELERSIFNSNDEDNNLYTKIRPGTTITVCSTFILKNNVSNVELEIDEWISFDNDVEDLMLLSLN